MDGAIAAFTADSMRQLTSRFNLGTGMSGIGSAHSLQSGLFEQLLSAPSSSSDRPSVSSSDNYAQSSRDPWVSQDQGNRSAQATKSSDRDDRQHVRASDEEDEESESTAQVVATATTGPLPLQTVGNSAGADTAQGQTTDGLSTDGAAAEGPPVSGDVSGGDVSGDTINKDVLAAETAGGEATLEHAAAENTSGNATGDEDARASSSRALSSESLNSVDEQPAHSAQDEIASGDDSVAGSDRLSAGAGAMSAAAGAEVGDANQGESVAQAAADPPADMSAIPITDSAAVEAAADDSASSPAEDELSRAVGDDPRAQSRHQAQAEEQSQARQPADSTAANDSKSRGNRREKWFERGEDNSATAGGKSNTSAAQTSSAVDKLSAGVDRAQDAALAAEQAQEAAAAAAAAVAENDVAHMPPETLPQVQPPAPLVAMLANEGRLSAMDDAGGSPLPGDRSSTQGNSVEGIEASQRQPSAQRADANSAAPDAQRADVLTQAERVRLVQRVSRSFARLGPMGGQISLKLHPPQLGALNVQVRMEGRTMTAKLTTESGAARDAILESLPVLRTRLAEQGFEISSFQVEVADSQSDVNSGSDQSRSDADHMGGRENRQAEQGTDYRRLSAQRRSAGEGYDVSQSSYGPSLAAWELPRGVDVQA